MTFKPIEVPSAWQTKDEKTREDLRRLRVALEQLNRQMKDLQDQIDDSGTGDGTVTSITSTGGSVTVTNPSGPVVNLEVPAGTSLTSSAPANVTKAAAAVGVATTAARADHKHDVTTAVAGAATPGDAAAEGTATSLARSDHKHSLAAFGTTAGTFLQGNQAAGGDSSGTLNALVNTQARGLRETTGPTTLTMGAVADLQLLVRSGSTIIGVDRDPSSEFWAAPATPHTNDREMVTLPSGWALYKFVASLGVLTTPNASPINPIGSNTSGVPRIEVTTKKRSWLQIQPDTTTGVLWFYGFSFGALGADHIFRSRIRLPWKLSGISNNAPNWKFVVYANGAGNVPSRLTAGVRFGWETDAGVANLVAASLTAGVGTNLVVLSNIQTTPGIYIDGELIVWKSANGYLFFYSSPIQTMFLGSVAFGVSDGVSTGQSAWVGFEFQQDANTWSGIGTGAYPPISADYYRQEDNATPWI